MNIVWAWSNDKKNPEMLRFVPDHLETKKMCKNAVKKLLFVITYVPDRYSDANDELFL